MTSKWISLVALSVLLSSCATNDFDGSQRFSGVWLYQFEGSTFIEDATQVPRERPAYEASDWLSYSPDLRQLVTGNFGFDRNLGCYPVQPFLITFLGQRSTDELERGHLGAWRSGITVHKTLRVERLGPPFCYDR